MLGHFAGGASAATGHAGGAQLNPLNRALLRLWTPARALNPLVQSAATTMGHVFDSLGVLRPRPHNLIRNSVMQGARAGTPGVLPDRWFTGASGGLAWQVVGVNVEAGMVYTEVRISGTTTAAAASVVIFFDQTTGIPAAAGQQYTASVHLTRVAGSYPAIAQHYIYEFSASSQINQFAETLPASTPGTLADNRVSITRTLTQAATAFTLSGVYFQAPTIGTMVDFTIRIAAPQINLGGLQPFYPTGTYNLARFTESLDNAAWTKVGSSVTPDATADHTGLGRADKLVETATTGGHYVEQDMPTFTGNTHTTYWDVKAGERTSVNFENYSIPTTSVLANVRFNALTGVFSGALTQNGAQLATFAEALPNGWWRVRLTITLGGADTAVRTRCALISGSTTVYAGDGTSGVFLNRVQVNAGGVMPYQAVLGATPSPAAWFGPRASYDPANLAAGPFVVTRASRTNSIRNNTMQGASLPSTLPTNWSIGGGSGLSVEVLSRFSAFNMDVIRLRISGTPTSSSVGIRPEGSPTQIAAANGQLWTNRFFCRLVSSPIASGLSIRSDITSFDSAGVILNGGGGSNILSSIPVGASAALSGFQSNWTMSSASTAFVRSQILFTYNSGSPFDVTIDIAVPELSQGDILPWEPPILTYGASATVGADDPFVELAQVAGFSPTEGFLYADWEHSSTASFPAVASLNDGTVSNRINLISSTTTRNRGGVAFGGAIQADLDQANYVTGTRAKGVIAFAANNFGVSFNGAAVSKDTSGAVPSVTRLQLGRQSGGLDLLNGRIFDLALDNKRPPDGALQRMTR